MGECLHTGIAVLRSSVNSATVKRRTEPCSSSMEQQQILDQEQSRDSYPHLWSYRRVPQLLCLMSLYNTWFVLVKSVTLKWRGRRTERKYMEIFLRVFEDLWRDLKYTAFVVTHRHKFCCLRLSRRWEQSCVSLAEGRAHSWKSLSTGWFWDRLTVICWNISWIIQ